MTTNGDYYNESYAPIHSDYLAAEAHARRAASDRTVPTPRATVNNQELSRPKRRSRYDENNYALPDEEYDEKEETNEDEEHADEEDDNDMDEDEDYGGENEDDHHEKEIEIKMEIPSRIPIH